VERAIEFLGSPDIGVDDRHGPRLYSRFLHGLFERVRTPPGKISRSRSKRKAPGRLAPAPELSTNVQPREHPMKPVSMNHFEPLAVPQRSTPFDHFAWPTEVDPSAGGSALGLGLHASEFFYSPLPFDSDLVESMQSLSSLSEMQDATLPGTHIYSHPHFQSHQH
jgi:hypothetical protein